MTRERYARLSGQPVFDSMGQKLGDIRRIFFDADTDQPSWVTVGARRYGDREAVVPLAGSRIGPSGLAVGVRGSLVKDAPAIEPDRDLTEQDTERVARHYEQESLEDQSAPTRTELTTFEEQLEVGAETVETGKAKLHKHVETEPVGTSVQLRHEKARIEHVPADSDQPSSHRFDDEDAEITLHDQRPTVSKRAVPTETVRLEADETTEDRRITDELRRERIDVEESADEEQPSRRRR